MTRSTPTLRELALARRLPDHQMMDRETLGWIEVNKPSASSVPVTLRSRAMMLVPDAGWFAVPALADSLHGVRHNTRVGLLASLLAAEHDLNRDDTVALCVVGAVHDCRRFDDRDDPGHGERAAAWFLRDHSAITAAFGLNVPEPALHRAAIAIGLHDVPYDAFTAAQDHAYRQAQHLVDLLKTADCLDRYRLPLARWWPDISRLRVPVPDWFHGLAVDLVLRSEKARLDGADQRDALDHARQILTSQP